MNININKVKIFVTVPPANVQSVREAICHAGAGIIGNYTHCTTATNVTGTFKPNSHAHPYLGEKDQLTFVPEVKIEAICHIDQAKFVISKIREAHPYEEPAIDIVPLIDEQSL